MFHLNNTFSNSFQDFFKHFNDNKNSYMTQFYTIAEIFYFANDSKILHFSCRYYYKNWSWFMNYILNRLGISELPVQHMTIQPMYMSTIT